MDTILYIIMQLVFVSYVSFIWIRYGLQKSISESYYTLPINLRPLFTFFCWGFAFPAMILGDSVFMFFAGTGICFVGAAANMHEQLVRTVHISAAVLGISSAFMAIIFQYGMWGIALGYVISMPLVYFLDRKHFIWWIEILAFMSISTVLGIQIF